MSSRPVGAALLNHVLFLFQSHCECLPGFELRPNASCGLKEACQPQSCHRDADCTTVGPGALR